MNPEIPAKKGRAVLSIPISWRSLGESEHFSVDHDRFHNLVRITRVSDLYADTQALHAAHEWLQNALAGFERPRLVLVYDGRRGKLRNDPEFEAAIKQVLPALTQGWREFISINNTPAIKIQFFRWSQEGTSAPIRVFNDEQEALSFALEVSLGPD
ncbi:MAG: hypothetical protein ABI488_13650 [Polyangiaceae bacterium]